MSDLFKASAKSVPVPAAAGGAGRPPSPEYLAIRELIESLVAEGVPSTSARVITVNDAEKVTLVLGLLRRAGRTTNPQVSIRNQTREDGTKVHITYWAVPLIARPRKPKSDAPTAE